MPSGHLRNSCYLVKNKISLYTEMYLGRKVFIMGLIWSLIVGAIIGAIAGA
ncbi:TPA: GlsB/YeaQ/YmgE family stress response membrane protein, partial [Streptococcus agalactiae]|nr:GlsB/YeaQ/YmgE family stress response membrane protein [Streptococcus agalactiae]